MNIDYLINASSSQLPTMRVRTLEIRWHGGDPIYACDFQPLPQNALKKLLAPRIGHKDATSGVSQAYRFATAGGDNNVRVSKRVKRLYCYV